MRYVASNTIFIFEALVYVLGNTLGLLTPVLDTMFPRMASGYLRILKPDLLISFLQGKFKLPFPIIYSLLKICLGP